MIRSLIALLALSTLSIHEVQAAPFNEINLLEHFATRGGRVYYDTDKCKETGALGLQGGNQIHICTDAHEGNVAELKDTIRHEVWHVVQMCNEGPVTKDPIKMISEAHAIGWTGYGYSDPHVWHIEAEAHIAAAVFTPEQIKIALDQYCT